MAGDGDHQAQTLATFLDVTGADDTMATSILEATNWELEDAIQLFYAGGIQESAAAAPPPAAAPVDEAPRASDAGFQGGEDYVRPPLPVRREALYDDDYMYRGIAHNMGPAGPPLVDAFRNFREEALQRARQIEVNGDDDAEEEEEDERAAFGVANEARRGNLGALFAAPVDLMFRGTFQMAKDEAVRKGRWLLVNLQSRTEFASHMLNRDTWSHEAAKEAIRGYFVFLQVYNDTEEGRKIMTYYKLHNAPVILVVDPQTGAKQSQWDGMVEHERLLEDLVPFMDKGPLERRSAVKRSRDSSGRSSAEAGPSAQSVRTEGTSGADGTGPHEETEEEMLQRALAASLQDQTMQQPAVDSNDAALEAALRASSQESPPAPAKVTWPNLPPEPEATAAGSCRVAIRFPDGKRGQRRFMSSDSVKVLGSFCCSQVPEAADRPFRLAKSMGGGNVQLLDSSLTIADAEVCNSMLAMTWL